MHEIDASEIVFPPTPLVIAASRLLEQGIKRTLKGYGDTQLPWKYEADFEARTLLWLVIRNSEGVYELARKDLVMLPAALSATRSAFEISIRALWLLQPDDPFEREIRWLAQLATEESHHERMAKRLGELGVDASQHINSGASVRKFRCNVTEVLPPGYIPMKQLPNLEAMMSSLNLRHLYLHYMILSQYAHGTHEAGRLYRKNLGCGKRGGEFVRSSDWRYPLEICFFAVSNIGNRLIERLGGSPKAHITDAFQHKFQVALKRLQNEKKEYMPAA